MTLNAILHESVNYEAVPSGASGAWYVATDALEGKSVEEICSQNSSGAIVLACRRGFWGGNLNKEEVELFLWGTAEQLEMARATLKLQPAVDALLDHPELYWG